MSAVTYFRSTAPTLPDLSSLDFEAHSPNWEKRPSFRTERLGCQWTDFYKIWYLGIFHKSVLKIKLSLKPNRTNRYFTWKPTYIFDCISLVSCRENQNTHFVFSDFFLRIVPSMGMWKNIVEPDGAQTTIWCMCIACLVPKSKITHLDYVLLIAFPMHHWLHERSSVVRYTYIAFVLCLIISITLLTLLKYRGFGYDHDPKCAKRISFHWYFSTF